MVRIVCNAAAAVVVWQELGESRYDSAFGLASVDDGDEVAEVRVESREVDNCADVH